MYIAKQYNDYFHGDVLDFGHKDQFLFDHRILEDCVNIKKRPVKPQRYVGNPIIKQDNPWEKAIHSPNVLYDTKDGIYKMWYFTLHPYSRLCEQTMHYAFSENGYQWIKPRINKYFVNDFGENNIVAVDLGGRVIYDPLDTENKRFKLVHDTVVSGGIKLSYSSDGINWNLDGRNPLKNLQYPAIFDIVFNNNRQKWQLFIRPVFYCSGDYSGIRDSNVYENSGNRRRRIAICESQDLVNWTFPRIVCMPDETDENEFDRISVIQHNDILIGFLGTFDANDEVPPDEDVIKGQRLKTSIVYSHLGYRWESLPNQSESLYFEHGEKSDFDSQLVCITSPLVDLRDGLSTLFYCGGKWTVPYRGYYQGGVGMLQIVKNRFIESYAYGDAGYILTKEFVLSGNCLEVNYQCLSRNGYIKVEIVQRPDLNDEQVNLQTNPALYTQIHGGSLIHGYTLEECDPLKGNAIDKIVTWNNNSNMEALRGKPVCLRFFIKDAGVYSFRVFNEKKI